VIARIPLAAILIALMLLSLPSPIRGQSAPTAQIIRVSCPSQLSAGDHFAVNVSIQYSFDGWTFADLGLFEENFTNILDYVHYYLTGNTVRNFTLTGVAPSTSTDLLLRLTTRYWYNEFWLTDANATGYCSVKVLASNGQPVERPSVVRIGENDWYFWNNSASDALLVWLSGGHAFSDHVTINPYEMENFGVMSLVGDLSKHYSVLALEKGSEVHSVAVTNQPYYALGYYPGSSVLRDLRGWSLDHGYNFTYLIGYSTGGVAAGYEVAVNHPDTWTAPNGAVIVSAPLDGFADNLLGSSMKANGLKANVALLYGGIWSDTVLPQGMKFYHNAPNKTSAPWYLKEWAFFPMASHDVWVKEEDGAHYNNAAFNTTAQFIERSKTPFDKVAKWNDGGIQVVDVTASNSTLEQRPKTLGTNFTVAAGQTLQIKIWLYNCTSSGNCSRSNVSDVRVDLYSSEGYVDSRYTNTRGYEEFTLVVPQGWANRTIKIFATLGGEFRGKYTPTVTLHVS
jgi:hypothetical protein